MLATSDVRSSRTLARFAIGALLTCTLTFGVTACSRTQRHSTSAQIGQVQHIPPIDAKSGDDVMDLELRFIECPGDARKFVRTDSAFIACMGQRPQTGDKVAVELVSSYGFERGRYRSEVVRIGACDVKLDPKEEANYETVQTCTDVVTSGAVVGVHCDLTRNEALLAKCPWLRRR